MTDLTTKLMDISMVLDNYELPDGTNIIKETYNILDECIQSTDKIGKIHYRTEPLSFEKVKEKSLKSVKKYINRLHEAAIDPDHSRTYRNESESRESYLELFKNNMLEIGQKYSHTMSEEIKKDLEPEPVQNFNPLITGIGTVMNYIKNKGKTSSQIRYQKNQKKANQLMATMGAASAAGMVGIGIAAGAASMVGNVNNIKTNANQRKINNATKVLQKMLDQKQQPKVEVVETFNLQDEWDQVFSEGAR